MCVEQRSGETASQLRWMGSVDFAIEDGAVGMRGDGGVRMCEPVGDGWYAGVSAYDLVWSGCLISL